MRWFLKASFALFGLDKALPYRFVKTVYIGSVTVNFAMVGNGHRAQTRIDSVLAHKHNRVKSVVGIVGMQMKINKIFKTHLYTPRKIIFT